MFNINKIRKDFPMLNKSMQGHPLVFLDNASTTFKPQCVIDAINEYYLNQTSNSHRGDYDLCYNLDQKVLNVRKAIAKFINSDFNEIVFTSGDSMSINMIAYGLIKKLKKGDEVLITEAEHASNVLPWFKVQELIGIKVKYIPLTKEGRLTIENVKKAITNKTKVISVAEIGNVLGYINPIKEITKLAHKNSILVVCDAAQAIAHKKVDVKDLDVDFLAFSAHKMYGPTGIGVLYGKFDLLKEMDPLMSGGGMNSRFDLCGAVEYLEPPVKFEAGTMNLAGIFGFEAAINYLSNIGMDNIQKYEKELRDYAIKKISEIKDIKIYNKNAESAIITINKGNIFAQDEATYLNSQGIAVRSGQHCAKILMNFLNTVATVRISFGIYTTKKDIDKLVNALKKGDFLDAYF